MEKWVQRNKRLYFFTQERGRGTYAKKKVG